MDKYLRNFRVRMKRLNGRVLEVMGGIGRERVGGLEKRLRVMVYEVELNNWERERKVMKEMVYGMELVRVEMEMEEEGE
jgi:hypothetical protein